MDKLLRGLLWVAGIVFVVFLIGRAFFFDLWTFPDDRRFAASVAPTLRAQDRLVLLKESNPGIGDLVRCTDPEDPAGFVVGRVAGRAHDHLDIEGNELRNDGHSYIAESSCRDRAMTLPNPGEGADIDVVCDRVEMGSGWHYRGHSAKPRFFTDQVSTDVRDGMLYLVSDNRGWHDDSRDYGQVPVASCSRRIIFRLWGGMGMGTDPWRFEFIH